MVKVLFFGTPHVAVPYLNWLLEHTTVTGVVCRPDEPVGRGHKLTPPPTKVVALEKNIPVFQPSGPWSDSSVQSLKALNADMGIVVAYGRILPVSIISVPRLGCLNIHFSLLPRYRGAAPIQWALMNGESKTGVTGFWLEEGLDSGPMACQAVQAIDPQDDVVSLREKLITRGLQVLETVLQDIENGKIIRERQSGDITLAPPLKKEDGKIQWTLPADNIVNLVRGLREWPGVSAEYQPEGAERKRLKIHSVRAEAETKKSVKQPGTILDASRQGVRVLSGNGIICLLTVQPEGKKEMPAWDFWQGAHLKIGDKLG